LGPSLLNHDHHIGEDNVDSSLALRTDSSPYDRTLPSSCLPLSTSSNTPGTPTRLIPRARGIKRGYKNFASPLACGVSIQDDPVWVWTLRPKEWSQIFIIESEWERLRSRHSSIWNKFKAAFDVIHPPIESHHRCHQASVWWVSGSLAYIETLRLPAEVGQVYWMHLSSRRWAKTKCDIVWKRISHIHVGGSTNARGTFGTRFLPSLNLPRELERSITHVLEFSVRPVSCSPDIRSPHYTLHDRLSLSQIDKPVLYPTYMSRTGWGFRSLTSQELHACFDLPDFIEWDSRYITSIVPLQLFRSVIDFVLDSIMVNNCRPEKCRKLNQGFARIPDVDGIWLPSIKAWLPGSWAEIDIADKAVKADDAQVDTRPWHQRISLILPCKSRSLFVLERLAMRRWRRGVTLSFFEYLKREYGSNWVTQLMISGPQPVVHRGLENAKRPHGHAFAPFLSKEGGVRQ
jgi:hypothetical protein